MKKRTVFVLILATIVFIGLIELNSSEKYSRNISISGLIIQDQQIKYFIPLIFISLIIAWGYALSKVMERKSFTIPEK